MLEEPQVSDAEPLAFRREDNVLRVRLNRARRANALDSALVDAFLAALERDSLAAGIRALVITGNGNNFCGGFDLSGIASLSEGDIVLRFLRLETLLQRLYHAPYVTIACAQGNVVGAGADIFAACEYRIAEPGAGFRMPGWQFGIALGTRRLSDRVGAHIAREMLATGRRLSSAAAQLCSLATHVVAVESWPSVVDEIIRDSASISNAARAQLYELTQSDHRAADTAALVASALRSPPLKDRLLAYAANAAAAKLGIP